MNKGSQEYDSSRGKNPSAMKRFSPRELSLSPNRNLFPAIGINVRDENKSVNRRLAAI